MKTLEILAAASLTVLLPAAGLAQQDAGPAPEVESVPAPDAPAADWEESYAPPAPEAQQAEEAQAEPAPAQAAPSGEWVWTQQYGWVWMPYGDVYTRVPTDGYGAPYMYVYYPAYGWSWVVAPWVWGYGPWPTFGVYGAVHFGWYEHGWWRSPHHWHYVGDPWRGGFPRGGPRAFPTPGRPGFRPGFRPAEPRPGFAPRPGVRSPAPAFRGTPAPFRGGATVAPRPSAPGAFTRAPAPAGRGAFSPGLSPGRAPSGGSFTPGGGGMRGGRAPSGGPAVRAPGGGHRPFFR